MKKSHSEEEVFIGHQIGRLEAMPKATSARELDVSWSCDFTAHFQSYFFASSSSFHHYLFLKRNLQIIRNDAMKYLLSPLCLLYLIVFVEVLHEL